MSPRLRFGVAHDFRCPPGSEFELRDVYRQTIEQIALLDRLGLDLVWFVGSSRVDLQACKLEYSIVSPK